MSPGSIRRVFLTHVNASLGERLRPPARARHVAGLWSMPASALHRTKVCTKSKGYTDRPHAGIQIPATWRSRSNQAWVLHASNTRIREPPLRNAWCGNQAGHSLQGFYGAILARFPNAAAVSVMRSRTGLWTLASNRLDHSELFVFVDRCRLLQLSL
jgi:hypothetical protein